MKRYITRFLKSVAVFFLAFPLLYILLAATLFDIPFQKCVGILLSPFYYLVTITVVVAGYGIWEMRHWSWHLFIVSQVLLAYENAVLAHGYAENHHRLLAFFLSLVLQGAVIYRVSREIRVPYFFPRIRWWESNPRYRLSVPAKLSDKNANFVEGEILDLSASGCFMKTRLDLPADEKVTVQFKIFNHDFSLEGITVWIAESTVTHPKGVGVKFMPIPKSQKRALRIVSRKVRKISSLYRRYRYLMSQDEFLRRLEEVETSVESGSS